MAKAVSELAKAGAKGLRAVARHRGALAATMRPALFDGGVPFARAFTASAAANMPTKALIEAAEEAERAAEAARKIAEDTEKAARRMRDTAARMAAERAAQEAAMMERTAARASAAAAEGGEVASLQPPAPSRLLLTAGDTHTAPPVAAMANALVVRKPAQVPAVIKADTGKGESKSGKGGAHAGAGAEARKLSHAEILGMLTVAYIALATITAPFRDDKSESPLYAKPEKGNRFVRSAEESAAFTLVRPKDKGALSGGIYHSPDGREWVMKGSTSQNALARELIIAQMYKILYRNPSPDTGIVQMPVEGSPDTIRLMSISEKFPGSMDLEQFAVEVHDNPDLREKLKTKPVIGVGKSLALDRLFDKHIDVKLANMVIVEEDDCFRVFPIDHEKGCGTNRNRSALHQIALIYTPPPLIPFLLTPSGVDMVRDQESPESMIRLFHEYDPSFGESSPLTGHPSLETLRPYLLNSIRRDKESGSIDRMYRRMANLNFKQVIDVAESVNGHFTEEQRRTFMNDLLERQDEVQKIVHRRDKERGIESVSPACACSYDDEVDSPRPESRMDDASRCAAAAASRLAEQDRTEGRV